MTDNSSPCKTHFDISLVAGGDPETCAVRDVLSHLSGKWGTLVLLCLGVKPHRFGALGRAIPQISKRMLTETLRELEQDGFVSRHVFKTRLPAVEYRLTELGQSFVKPLDELVGWAIDNHETIKDARRRYSARDEVASARLP
ncbi:helix-turn-helix domain-containing protein [Pseudomonas syringae group genomosp. 3]|uniref:winged helix-turn-helix transcriptional regulator n=1 Tax=Pseudomonas syringae group genomosp. 3 TaxID=251701 RepID=UPI000EFB2937|nr:helix-turn-helix domain-containing protein [Pseudomonas syringae group genomosp. 3]